MGKPKFIYSSEGFNKNVKLLGIAIYQTTVLSSEVFSSDYPGYDAFKRGLEIYDHRLRLLTEYEMRLVYKHRNKINEMLKEAGAHFEIPASGACWVAKDSGEMARAIDFVTGKEVKVRLAWALYAYIC